MAYSTDEQRQCIACLENIPLLATKCRFCGTFQPDAVAARVQLKQLREAADDGTADQQEAYQQYKLEVAHLPRWLRRLTSVVNTAREHPRVHRSLEFVGGVAAFTLAYSALDWLLGKPQGQYDHQAELYLLLKIGAGLLAYSFGALHFFRALYVILESVGRVLHDEKQARIDQGQALIKAKRFVELQKIGQREQAENTPAAVEPPKAFKTLADLDREKDQP